MEWAGPQSAPAGQEQYYANPLILLHETTFNVPALGLWRAEPVKLCLFLFFLKKQQKGWMEILGDVAVSLSSSVLFAISLIAQHSIY